MPQLFFTQITNISNKTTALVIQALLENLVTNDVYIMRLKMIFIITPHDNGADIFRVTLFVHPVLIEDNVLEHTSAEIP